jgi:DNA-binding MarR family transcriptional regulator
MRRLAWFRYRVRRFLRFSERVSRSCGITPQQHQLMLGVAGYTGRGWATISELAEFLQARHNAVVGLVQRAAKRGLVRKIPGQRDRRYVKVNLTRRGGAILEKISRANIAELRDLQIEVMRSPQSRPGDIPAAQGA